jgi:hypothetical protein
VLSEFLSVVASGASEQHDHQEVKMLKIDKYKKIEKKYGDVCSWAVWAKVGDTPKSNIADMRIFDINKNPGLLKILQPNIVMVALNFARDTTNFKKPFMNFHDSNPYGQDYKIRYAFEDTPYYGAYMTDIIKNYPEVDSNKVFQILKKNPDKVKENIDFFQEELNFVCSGKPLILAFGIQTFNMLEKNLDKSKYTKLIKITHYSHQISKERYREDVLGQIQASFNA